jgi:exonuclease SbcC
MRINSLRFKNINSLAGEWKIDFRDLAYLSTGIFAITGPTGAGKSTILDVISLALYGQTPRLGRITKSAGEVMSRQTGECLAEVEFTSDKGIFRCTWSQKRAHKKSDGELQPPKHEIVDLTTKKILEAKLIAVQQKVVEVTGLDYQQFTRSILLAQGEFGTFLDAKADERAPILEKITGTGIYGQISSKVHERYGMEKSALDALLEKADTLEMISPVQAVALKERNEHHEKEIHEVSKRCKKMEDAVAWLDNIAALEKEIADLEERERALTERKTATKRDLEALCLARRARDLEGIYSTLTALREQQEHETQEKTAYEERLAELSAKYTTTLEAFQLAQEHHGKVAGEKEREDDICRCVRELDIKIQGLRNQCDERIKEKRRLEEEVGTLKEAIRSAEMQVEGLRPELVQINGYLEEHPRDEKLIASLSGIESAVRQIHTTEETTEKRREELLKVEHTLADAEQVVIRRKKDLDKAAGKVQAAIVSSDRIKTELAEITGGRDGTTLRLLADGFTDRQHRLKDLLDLLVRIEADVDAQKKLVSKLDTSRAQRTAEEERYNALKKDAAVAAEFLRLSEENRVYLAHIKSLEESRKTLAEGKPCPLCGSTDHPWCTGAVPVPDDADKKHEAYKRENEELQIQLRKIEAELAGIIAGIQADETALGDREEKSVIATSELEAGCLALGIPVDPPLKPAIAAAQDECTARLEETRTILSRAEEKEKELRKEEQSFSNEKDDHEAFKRDYDQALVIRDRHIRDRDRLTREIAADGEDVHQQKAAFLESVQEYDVLVFSTSKMTEEILDALTKRRNNYVANLTRRQNLQERLQRDESEIKQNQSLLSAAEKRFEDISNTLTGLGREFSDLSTKRKNLYGDKDPAAEETRVAQMAKEAEAVLSAATDAKNIANTQKTACEEQIHALAGKIDTHIPVLIEHEQRFSDARSEAGFFREEEFLSARLSPDHLAELETLELDIKREETKIAAGLTERIGKLAAEKKRALTQENGKDIALAIENDKNRITRLQLDIGGIRNQLEQYNGQVKKQQELAEAIAKQRKEFAKWEKLHALIGSADGKKFRIFAQGLTFETLIVQANRHLRAMSDRYLLIRNKESPLDLDIVDNDQAGEIRTTKNLSGGERFIVSLALALGLSGMASHNIKIDSLFLDEGFGTLDPETLETALETLSSLQREGKIIGIISHVPALKERIPVQIQVEKIGGGRSRLYGPGCSGIR